MDYKNTLSADEVVGLMAERLKVSEAEVRRFLQAQAEVVWENAAAGKVKDGVRKGVVIPGVGMVQVLEKEGKKMVMAFGPKAGQTVQLPGKRLVKVWAADVGWEFVRGGAEKGKAGEKSGGGVPDVFGREERWRHERAEDGEDEVWEEG